MKTPIRRGSASPDDLAGREASAASPIWRTLGVLCLLLSGLFGVLKLIQRYAPRRSSTAQTQQIQMVDRLRLDTQTTVYLLRIGRRLLVAGQSAGGLNTLTEIEDSEEVAELMGSRRQMEDDRKSLGSLFSKGRTIRRDAATPEQAGSRIAETPEGVKPRTNQESWHA